MGAGSSSCTWVLGQPRWRGCPPSAHVPAVLLPAAGPTPTLGTGTCVCVVWGAGGKSPSNSSTGSCALSFLCNTQILCSAG